MDLCNLKEFLGRENQRFTCTDDPRGKGSSYVAHIEHRVDNPLSGKALEALKSDYVHLDQLLDFYSEFGSLRLYCDTNSTSSAFYLARPDQWAQLRQEFMLWVSMLDEDEAEEVLPAWLDSAIVIGEIPESGNYLLMPAGGELAGRIFLFEHDGFEFREEARDLESYLEKITTPGEALFQQIAAHTRYTDRETNIQWLVRDYQHG